MSNITHLGKIWRPFHTTQQKWSSVTATTVGRNSAVHRRVQLQHLAPSQAMAKQWIQLSNKLHYMLVSTCDGPTSTLCTLGERARQKPQLDNRKFEESFATRGLQLANSEQDNGTLFPDDVKSEMLRNERPQRTDPSHDRRNGGTGKEGNQPIGQGATRIWKRKRIQQQMIRQRSYHTRQGGKGSKATNVSYRRGQPGHTAHLQLRHQWPDR